MSTDRSPTNGSNPPPEGGVSRRRFLQSLVGAGAGAGLVAAGFRLWPDGAPSSPGSTPASSTTTPTTPATTAAETTTTQADVPEFTVADYADNIQRGGPPKDGIPPIDEPVYAAASEVDFLEDADVVFGLSHEGVVRAYPQLILVFHEIVNDQFPDGPLTVTYCPLTGSTVGFRGVSPDGDPLSFGTSGNLVNSNLLMYDRQTDSNWPQILAMAINGPAQGAVLEETPVVWTTWGRWRELFPDSEVLTTDTGYVRSYGSDPYGTYNPLDGYYQPDSQAIFPTMWTDDRFPAKEVFIGAKRRRSRLAVRKSTLRDRQVVSVTMEDEPVAVLCDLALDEGRAFLASSGGRRLELEAGGTPGTFEDRSGRGAWDTSGLPIGEGDPLEPLASYDVMWFSWVAFFPHTEVVA